MYFQVIIIGIIFFILKKHWRNNKFNQLHQIPGPKSLPILGNVLEFLGSPSDIFQKLTKFAKSTDCGMFSLWIWNKPFVFLTRAETIQPILASSVLLTKDDNYKLLSDWLGIGIVLSDGDIWHRRRKLLTPTFHVSILESFLPIMEKESKILVEKLSADIGRTINIESLLTSCALGIITETTMGVNIHAQTTNNHPYLDAIHNLEDIIIQRIYTPFWNNDKYFRFTKTYSKWIQYVNIVHTFALNVITDRRSKFRIKSENEFYQEKKRAFLDYLLEDGMLDQVALRDEVNTFMFAGHDTTATATKWCLFMLGHNSEIQGKVHEEIDSIIHQKDDPITMNEIRSMKYLERCIKETLRLYPSIANIARHLTQNVEINGFTLPKGTSVILDFYSLHRDTRYFPKPEVFDPDRFLPENQVNKHQFAYLPFSAGMRNCLGQKFAMIAIKMMIASILKQYRVESIQKMEDIHIKFNLTLKSEENILLKFHPRSP